MTLVSPGILKAAMGLLWATAQPFWSLSHWQLSQRSDLM